jgi:molecular chaperone DnaJ
MGLQDDDNPFYKGMDAYQILEVQRGADVKDIKSSYRKMVAKWHPDKFPDDEAKKAEGGKRMEKINRAWFILSDDDRRRRYDQYGDAGIGTSASSEEQMKNGGPGFGGLGGGVDVGDVSDIFEAFFGGGMGGSRGRTERNPNAPVAGDDLQVQVEIPFMTSIFGGQEKVKVRRLENCGTCTGTGIKPGAKVKTCSSCGGRGVVNNVPDSVWCIQQCANLRKLSRIWTRSIRVLSYM